MVKNILILRFGNEFFGATWNRHHIDNVQVKNITTGLGYEHRQSSNVLDRSHSRSHSEPKGEEDISMSSASFAMSCRTVSVELYQVIDGRILSYL